MEIVAELLGICDPPAVRGPRRVEIGEGRVVAVAVDLEHRPAREIDEPQVHALVDAGKLLAVGGEADVIEERRRRAQRNLARRADAVGAAYVQGVLAALVGEVRHRPAVWRPGGVAVGNTRALGDGADVAFLGRNREDLAVRLEQHPLAGGRQRRVQDVTAFQLLEARAHLGQVGGNRHGDAPILA